MKCLFDDDRIKIRERTLKLVRLTEPDRESAKILKSLKRKEQGLI
jgi:hypothetical protein